MSKTGLLFLCYLFFLNTTFSQKRNTFAYGKDTLDIIHTSILLLNDRPLYEFRPPEDSKVKGFSYLDALHFELQYDILEEYNGTYKNNVGDIFCTFEVRHENYMMCWIADHIAEFEIVSNLYDLQIGNIRKTTIGGKVNRFKRKFKNSYKAGEAEGKLSIIMSAPIVWMYGDYYFEMLTLYYNTEGIIKRITLEEVHGCCTDAKATQ